MTNMLKKLGFKGFSEETVKTLQIKSFKDFITISEERALILGEGNCANLMNAIDNFLSNPITDYDVVGSLGFTGIANAKWKAILKVMSLSNIIKSSDPIIMAVLGPNGNGIGIKTANVIIKERKYFMEDLIFIVNNLPNVIFTKDCDDVSLSKVIRFSGIRDKELENKLRLMGHDCSDGSVTNNTNILIVPYNGFISTKVEKAMSKGIKIIPLDEFKLNMETYLSE